jgi:hypothetical protein
MAVGGDGDAVRHAGDIGHAVRIIGAARGMASARQTHLDQFLESSYSFLNEALLALARTPDAGASAVRPVPHRRSTTGIPAFRDGHPKVKDLAEDTFDLMCVLGVAE